MAFKARGLSLVNTDLMSVGTREKLYANGGIFSITSRILVVDLLTDLLPPESITGMIVLHADKLVATSLEAFILRIYRQRNKVGFLKAFSDNPEGFTVGFNPLATMMRNLFMRKASFWPRYHTTVQSSLQGKKKAEVIELEVPMTDAMRDIQTAIMDCVQASISELKKGNPGVNMADWNIDSAIHRNFDMIVRRQLDQVWHRVSWKTKQIVNDLTVLRGLMDALLTYDCVLFLKHLDTILAAHSPPPGSSRQNMSPWLLLDSAHIIFDTARRRVYTGKLDSDTNTIGPVLEEQPKWQQLADTLQEIEQDMYYEPIIHDDSNGTILVMCKDTATCRQLREYLQNMYIRTEEDMIDDDDDGGPAPSAKFIMKRKLHRYLNWKKEFTKISASLFTETQKAISGNPSRGQNSFSTRGKPINKRRRVRGGGVSSASPSRRPDDAAQNGKMSLDVATLLSEVGQGDNIPEQKEEVINDPLEDMEDYYRLFDMSDLVIIHAYDGDNDEHLLEEVKPRHIIMYEPEPTFIRRIEVYRSSHNDRNVRSYYMCYSGSIEEQRFLYAVRREKDAFTKIIKEKANMSIVLTTDAKGIEDPQESFLRTVNTRIAGGGRLAATAEPPRVVVDVREFRSSLPSLLHGRSMVVVPCMLTVGDYVLSPKICVERKSIKDLITSFKDGRLYAQVETMFEHYESPMLLIEFEQNKSFTLEPFADLSNSMGTSTSTTAADLQSKIVLLTLAFPRLRIIWSSDPYQTAEIFENLKTQEAEPDPVAAAKVGLDAGTGAEEQAFNREPQDMLRVIPGITSKNLKNLVLQVENIVELSNMSVDELEPIIGREAGRQVYQFFYKNVLDD
jgi:DNA excision repair protein ERCC-4